MDNMATIGMLIRMNMPITVIMFTLITTRLSFWISMKMVILLLTRTVTLQEMAIISLREEKRP